MGRLFRISFARNGMNQPCAYAGDSAANHINQSKRRWYGATWGGRRLTSPGFPLNSYSRHSVADVIVVSSVPSTMTSSRSRVTLPKAPYVFTRCSELKLAFIDCVGEAMFLVGQ